MLDLTLIIPLVEDKDAFGIVFQIDGSTSSLVVRWVFAFVIEGGDGGASGHLARFRVGDLLALFPCSRGRRIGCLADEFHALGVLEALTYLAFPNTSFS